MAEPARYDSKQKQLVHLMMEAVLKGVALDDFCAECYPSVCAGFTPEMETSARIRRLIEHASGQNQLGQLIANVERAQPEAYRNFVRRVRDAQSPPPSEETSPPRPAPLQTIMPPGITPTRVAYEPEGLLHQLLAGRYQIEEILDKSGLGAVFKAYDTKLQIHVAIKVINLKKVSQPAMRQRVSQEVRTAMKLDHPGIVKFYDFEQDEALIYIFMEFISGYNLNEAGRRFRSLEKNTFIPPVAQLMQQICLIVDYLHQQGVLHPSLKPENIMLKPGQTDEEPDWRPVLINLGLLRPHREGLRTDEELPPEQLTYSVSPELLIGHTTDVRTDVYALGIILYELAVGRPPFSPGNLAEAFHLHVNVPPPAPRSVEPELPAALEQIILKALAKDPPDRFLSARRMAQALADMINLPAALVAGGRREIVVSTDTQPLVVTPGESTVARLLLRNDTRIEDHYQVRVQGIPPEWVTINPSGTTLTPGEEVEVEIVIQPPRTFLSRAGRHALTVRVIGQRDARQVDEFKRILTIAPYVHYQSRLWPQRVRSNQLTQVTVDNESNVAETFTVQARPDENLVFEPESAQLRLAAGESGTADFRVSYRRAFLIGGTRVQTFSFVVDSPHSHPVIHSGEVLARSPVATRWLLGALLLVFLCLCAMAAFYPLINPPPAAATVTIALVTQAAVNQQATINAATAQVFAAQTATLAAATVQANQAQAGAAQAATATTAWLQSDYDRDGLTNGEELGLRTLPEDWDSDDDGLDDGAEVRQFSTNPVNPDTDYDGILDGEEIRRGLNPLSRDTDNDSTPDSTDADPGRVPTTTPTVTPNPTATRVPVIRFSNTTYTVDEREGEAVVTVLLDAPVANQVAVDYATSSSTAGAGGDFRTTIGTLVFDPGETVERFIVPIVNDTVDEPDETLLLSLSNPRGANLNFNSQASLVILDDDEPISIRFGQGSRLLGLLDAGNVPVYEVNENQGRAIIDVILSAPAGQEIRVDYATNDSTAVAGQDYQIARGTLVFYSGTNRQTFDVIIINDNLDESEKPSS